MSSYAPPFIGATGLTLPTYQQILNLLVTNAQAIYGPGEYLGTDSALYQMLAVQALAMADNYAAAQLAFNNFMPPTAVGAALSLIVAYNGLTRLVASYSTCPVTISGTPGTSITNGLIRDSVPQQGYLWSLPTPLLIPASGTLNTVATCQVIGAVPAPIGTFTAQGIATPTSGWTGLSNASPAALGQPTEQDSQLRARQALSTELPSETLLAGTVAAIAAIEGVTRYNVLENPTGAVDGYGNPPHSVTATVEGGTDLAVATAIYNNRGIGCFTNGTDEVPVTDPNTGAIFTVGFYRPAYVQVYVVVNIHALPGYSASIGQAVLNNVVNYLNSLQIGELVTYSALVYAAMTAQPNVQQPLFSIYSLFLGTAPGPTTTTDIPIAFNAVAQGSAPEVQVNLV